MDGDVYEDDSVMALLASLEKDAMQVNEGSTSSCQQNVPQRIKLDPSCLHSDHTRRRHDLSNDLFATLQDGKAQVDYLHALSGDLTSPPSSLARYALTYLEYGAEEAHFQLFEDDLVLPDKKLQHFISGDRERCQHFRDEELSTFMKAVFVHIELMAPTSVVLAGWDLYHAHGFVHYNKESGVADIGFLFHAKEFPKEYRHSADGPIYPLGHEAMKGEQDPRLGTKCSTEDDDFFLRNYLWVHSTNTVYLIDTYACPSTMLQNEEFHTVSCTWFDGGIGGAFDVNYFPHAQSSLICSSLVQHRELVCDAQHFAKAHLTRASSVTDSSSFHANSSNIIQTALDRIREDVMWVWCVEQITLLTASSTLHANEGIYCCAHYRKGFPPDMKLLPALNQLEAMVNEFSISELNRLVDIMDPAEADVKQEEGQEDTKKPQIDADMPRRADRVPVLLRPYLRQLMDDRRDELLMAEEAFYKRELLKLVSKGFDHEDATHALHRTKSGHLLQNAWSGYRAENLLRVLHPQYRTSEQLESYGDSKHSLPLCEEVLRMTFDADVALEVLHVHNTMHVENTAVEDGDDDEAVLERVKMLAKQIMKRRKEESDARWAAKMAAIKAKVMSETVKT